MNNFESSHEKDDNSHQEIFDNSDLWDQHIAKVGKGFSDREDNTLLQEDFDHGVDFIAGRQYSDGFGAWDPGQGEWTLEKPEKVADFDEKLLNGEYRVQVDFVAVGQPDGPETPGHVWTARLFDQKEDREIEGSRVFGNKISHTVTAALKHMPEWGKVEWKPTKEEQAFLNRRKWERHFDEIASAVDYHWSNSEKLEQKDQIQSILKKEFPLIEELLANGGAKKWMKSKLSSGSPIIVKNVRNLEDICHIAYCLNEYFKNPLGWKHAYPDDEIFQRKLVEDPDPDYHSENEEGDGWLPPPQWK